MNRVLWTAAALSAAVVVFGVASLPPAQHVLTADDDGTVAGAVHIHTNRSDGRSSPDVIAAAAARAGLKFIVLTDHGDGTHTPDPPTYRSGVLCLDGVEVSTSEGHLLAIGLPRTPYALGGEARGVVEDVARLGGIGVAAHPDSPKEELRWRAWSEPVDGVELVNLDTSWRLHAFGSSSIPRLSLLRSIITYPFRAAETIAAVVRPTPSAIGSWSARAMTHRTLILAGSDAHARLALMDVDPGENRWTLPLPGYEASFRALSVRVTPDRPLTGDAAADSVSLLHGLRAGHTYIAVDGLAAPAFFEFTASNHSGRARQGDELRDDGEVTLRVRSNAPVGFRTAVFRDDVRIETSGAASELTVKAPSGPAVYRVEIRSSDREDAPVWLMSNPIYVRGPRSDTTVSRPAPGAEVVLFNGKSSEGWRVEAVAPAAGTMALTSEVIELHYTSPSGRAAGSVALLAESAEVPRSDRLTLSIRADRPMRPSVQLRMNRPGYPAERWQRTIYVDETLRTYVVYFDELTPVDPERSSSLPLEHMPYVLIAIDPEKMGKEGRLQITRAALHRR